MTGFTRTFALALALALAPACGSEDPATIDGGAIGDARAATDATLSERLLPLEVGRSWTYRVVPSGGAPETKVHRVVALEDVGGDKAGTLAYRLRTERPDGVTVSWQEDTGSSIVRHREQELSLGGTLLVEQWYLPSRLRVDDTPAHRAQDATWDVEYLERTVGVGDVARVDRWLVEAIGEEVTVPAGTFTCVRLRRSGTEPGQATKQYWFAPGVGKVKEEGGQLEELTAMETP